MNFAKVVRTVTNVSKIAIITLITYNVYLNCYKRLQTLINFIKLFSNCFNYLLHFFNNCLIFTQI